MGGRSRNGKADHTRRSWSDREERMLLVALKDLVNHGWKSDNGFRSGYLTRVDKAIRREFADTDLKIQPHIQSKINTWKRCYHSLAFILGRSGVGFNSRGDFKIDCDDDQWSQIVKVDSNAKHMRFKSWPYWEDWKLIYGKDQAGGGLAEDMIDAREKLNLTTIPTSETPPDIYTVGLDDVFTQEQVHESLSQETAADSCTRSMKSSGSTKQTNRKRKTVDSLDAILEVMSEMHKDTNQHLEKMSSRIGYDFDLSAKRTEVSRLLGSITLLTQKQRFLACDILVKEPECLDLFTGMSEVDKTDYVIHILEELYGG
ncbi:hypothetical protein AAHA92_31039 [Salvia divinorum]|uniref:Myb/SANT-like domain-containing protein n=2 Tax=Salvia divinorum TaxID=28513 RepID=A0ABD1FVD4_SALDI